MDAKWRIQLSSNKIIKPSIPTPSHLKTYQLSLLDQLNDGSYIPIALFFPQNQDNSSTQISQILEDSLSELLTSYYPFAGTLSPNGNSVECNDKGVSFSEAVINCQMSEFMEETDTRVQDLVFPNKFAWGNMGKEDYLLFVQLTHFDCGGKALSIRIAHKIGDGCSLTNLLFDWAEMNISCLHQPCHHLGDQKRPSPQFIGASLFPPIDDDRTSPLYTMGIHGEVACKRFRFSGTSLAKLKALVAAEDHDLLSSSSDTKQRRITRVELVTSILFKCAVAATAKTSPQLQGSTFIIKPSNLMQVANLRRLTTPLLGPNAIGNLYTYMDLVIENKEQMKLSGLVKEGRKTKLELQASMKKYQDGTSKNDLQQLILENDKKMAVRFEKDVYLCSSFCGYSLYNADFGFGLPIWAILGSVHGADKIFFLMDNLEGDGVEALVTLEAKVMSVFENEEEIRSFASII